MYIQLNHRSNPRNCPFLFHSLVADCNRQRGDRIDNRPRSGRIPIHRPEFDTREVVCGDIPIVPRRYQYPQRVGSRCPSLSLGEEVPNVVTVGSEPNDRASAKGNRGVETVVKEP